MPNRAARLEALLRNQFTPIVLQIEDESARHAGHAGAQPGGETHYNVTLVSDRFAGLGRVDRHRLVNTALSPEFAAGLHALSLMLKAPGEG